MPKKRPITPDDLKFSLKLAARLKGLRDDRGMTQEQVASLAGLSTKTYQRYEKGMLKGKKPANPEYFTLLGIAKALNVELRVLCNFSSIYIDPQVVDEITAKLVESGVEVAGITGSSAEDGEPGCGPQSKAALSDKDAHTLAEVPEGSALIVYGPFPKVTSGKKEDPDAEEGSGAEDGLDAEGDRCIEGDSGTGDDPFAWA